jgi:hypothetical protein
VRACDLEADIPAQARHEKAGAFSQSACAFVLGNARAARQWYGDQKVASATSERALKVLELTFGIESTVKGE